VYTFASNSTQQTALQDQPALSSGVYGFQFASFLLGNVTNFSLNQLASVTSGKQQYGLFFQDTWKVTRKLTVDYGLRWDYGTYGHERNGRLPNFDPLTANPSAGGHPGAQIFEATCKCNFADNYPYAIGPRLGVAYQLNPKTVLRGGFGVVYNSTTVVQAFGAVGNNSTTSTPAYGQYVGQLANGRWERWLAHPVCSTGIPIVPRANINGVWVCSAKSQGTWCWRRRTWQIAACGGARAA
jgi:outer membrane receptor protein involved in Fe transport